MSTELEVEEIGPEPRQHTKELDRSDYCHHLASSQSDPLFAFSPVTLLPPAHHLSSSESDPLFYFSPGTLLPPPLLNSSQVSINRCRGAHCNAIHRMHRRFFTTGMSRRCPMPSDFAHARSSHEAPEDEDYPPAEMNLQNSSWMCHHAILEDSSCKPARPVAAQKRN